MKIENYNLLKTEEAATLPDSSQTSPEGFRSPEGQNNYNSKFNKAYFCQRRCEARRKGQGFIPLNIPFFGCHVHHIDKSRIIFIPKLLHRSVWHNLNTNFGMLEINKIAFEYLKKERQLLCQIYIDKEA
jgi:hypothetical protein